LKMNKRLLKILFIMVVVVIQLFLITRYNPDLFSMELMASIGITVIGFLFGFIVMLFSFGSRKRSRNIYRSRKQNRKGSLGLFLMAVFLFGFIPGLFVNGYQNYQRRESAELIIEKLEQYFEEHGQYPIKLSELEPKYLSSVPTSNWGLSKIEFEYHTNIEKSYSINYKIGLGCGWSYSNGGGWQFYD